ncbi:hypothetical protein WJX74_010728 [Apatococcus lobatus]|uniref:Proteophosphoglycan ppg4 n=1 Tax=Apatococcus lobatus TaxID=904363 RepID=A0AAW1QTV9_9CHLO
MAGGISTREELAEAGRKKLEALRKRKAEKAQRDLGRSQEASATGAVTESSNALPPRAAGDLRESNDTQEVPPRYPWESRLESAQSTPASSSATAQHVDQLHAADPNTSVARHSTQQVSHSLASEPTLQIPPYLPASNSNAAEAISPGNPREHLSMAHPPSHSSGAHGNPSMLYMTSHMPESHPALPLEGIRPMSVSPASTQGHSRNPSQSADSAVNPTFAELPVSAPSRVGSYPFLSDLSNSSPSLLLGAQHLPASSADEPTPAPGLQPSGTSIYASGPAFNPPHHSEAAGEPPSASTHSRAEASSHASTAAAGQTTGAPASSESSPTEDAHVRQDQPSKAAPTKRGWGAFFGRSQQTTSPPPVPTEQPAVGDSQPTAEGSSPPQASSISMALPADVEPSKLKTEPAPRRSGSENSSSNSSNLAPDWLKQFPPPPLPPTRRSGSSPLSRPAAAAAAVPPPARGLPGSHTTPAGAATTQNPPIRPPHTASSPIPAARTPAAPLAAPPTSAASIATPTQPGTTASSGGMTGSSQVHESAAKSAGMGHHQDPPPVWLSPPKPGGTASAYAALSDSYQSPSPGRDRTAPHSEEPSSLRRSQQPAAVGNRIAGSIPDVSLAQSGAHVAIDDAASKHEAGSQPANGSPLLSEQSGRVQPMQDVYHPPASRQTHSPAGQPGSATQAGSSSNTSTAVLLDTTGDGPAAESGGAKQASRSSNTSPAGLFGGSSLFSDTATTKGHVSMSFSSQDGDKTAQPPEPFSIAGAAASTAASMAKPAQGAFRATLANGHADTFMPASSQGAAAAGNATPLHNGHAASADMHQQSASSGSQQSKQAASQQQPADQTRPGGPAKLAASRSYVLEGPSRQQDFAMLQQHIMDLTQAKFELQRGLAQQQTLAATLASENESMTADFNKQAARVQQLSKQLEGSAAEIQAQQLALNAMAGERDAGRSIVAEASERAQSLAGEVVGLEEARLQARSRELKLQQQLAAEQEAGRKAASAHHNLERDTTTLRAMVTTLQEENQAMSKMLRQTPGKLSFQASPSQPLPSIPRDSDAAPSGDTALGRSDAAPTRVASAPAAAHADVPLSRTVAEGLLKERGASLQGPGWDALPPGLQRLLPRPQISGAERSQEEAQVLASIHSLCGQLDEQRRSLVAAVNLKQAEIKRQQQYIEAVHERLQMRGLLHDLQDSFGSPLSQQESEAIQSSTQPTFRLATTDATMKPQRPSDAAASVKQEPHLRQPLPALELGEGVQSSGTEGSELVEGPSTPKQVASSASPAKPGSKSPGLFRWLGNMVAPAPPAHEAGSHAALSRSPSKTALPSA